MYLSSLKLQDFRNYKKRVFRFDEGTTLIVGANASGKTNILEALHLLAMGESFRAQRIEEMILFGEELARVSGIVENHSSGDSGQATNLEVLLTRGELNGKRVAKRRYSIDGVPKRLSDFVGRLVVVLFRPEDLQLILGSPVRRRDFLDEVLLQVDREYRRSLVSYERALVRRNKLLDAIRDEGASRTQLAFWDQLLIKHGQELTKQRAELLDFINSFEAEIDSFQVFYDNSTISELRLKKYMEQDIALGYTLVGPHKDDFVVQFKDEKELDLYGSRGEQRLAVLWLKLAELEFVAQKIGERPVLLLDDIFSELDQGHREMVLKVIPQQQTIITTTELRLVGDTSKMKVIELS
jgi:DNA replication and repair protein RecF